MMVLFNCLVSRGGQIHLSHYSSHFSGTKTFTKKCLYCIVADKSGTSLLTSWLPLAGGITGIGLAVPGATPHTSVSGVPDGTAQPGTVYVH